MLDENTNTNKELKTLRTYTSDMADAVRENEASVIKIALAEKEKREQEEVWKEAEGTKTSKTMYVIGGIVFLVIAIASIFYLFYIKKNTPTKQTNQSEKINTFFVYDSSVNIDASNATSANDIDKLIGEKTGVSSGLKAIFLEKKIGEANVLLTSSEFLHIIDAGASSALIRSLSDNFLLGKYATKGTTGEKTFLVFEIQNYSQVYASMLSWEKSLAKDLNPIFKIESEANTQVETNQNNQENTTPQINTENNPEIKTSILDKSWNDMVINNRDARALVNDKGEGVMFYAFINKDKLVITNDVNTLRDLITRLLNNG